MIRPLPNCDSPGPYPRPLSVPGACAYFAQTICQNGLVGQEDKNIDAHWPHLKNRMNLHLATLTISRFTIFRNVDKVMEEQVVELCIGDYSVDGIEKTPKTEFL